MSTAIERYNEYLRQMMAARGTPEQGPVRYYDTPGAQQGGTAGNIAAILGPASGAAARYGVQQLLAAKGAETAGQVVATMPTQLPAATAALEAPTLATVGGSAGGAGGAGATITATQAAPPAAELTTMQAIGSSPLLPVAGALGMYDVFKNERRGKRGMAQGAASGAAIGYYFGGAPGAAVGAAIGAAAAKLGDHKDKDRWKEEQQRVEKLAKAGVTGWDQVHANTPQLTQGRDKEQIIAEELAKQAAGKHANVEFAKTRDVKYLKPEDIWGYSTFGEKFGNDWFGKYTGDQRKQIAQTYLDAGAVKEGRGQIKLKDTPQIQDMIAKILAGQPVERPQLAVVGMPGAAIASNKWADSMPGARNWIRLQEGAQFPAGVGVGSWTGSKAPSLVIAPGAPSVPVTSNRLAVAVPAQLSYSEPRAPSNIKKFTNFLGQSKDR